MGMVLLGTWRLAVMSFLMSCQMRKRGQPSIWQRVGTLLYWIRHWLSLRMEGRHLLLSWLENPLQLLEDILISLRWEM